MTGERTDRYALPLIQAGQAQKEMTHNEALVRLDMLTMAAVRGFADAPPADPAPGECWIVGSPVDGTFSGQGDSIACWTASGWRFVAPREGMRAWLIDARCDAFFRDAAWHVGIVEARELRVAGNRVVGARQPAIARPAAGGSPDDEARIAIDTIIDVLEAHGLVAAA